MSVKLLIWCGLLVSGCYLSDISRKGFALVKDHISHIPCFRNSYLYGICGGLGTGLMYFLFTSKTRRSTHVAFSSFVGITLTYWCYCRYEYSRQELQLQKMKEYVQNKVLMEGTEMEKLSEADIMTVHNVEKNEA